LRHDLCVSCAQRRIQFGVEAAPVVVVTFQDGWSAADLTWLFERFGELFAQQRRYVLVVDTSLAHNTPSAVERKLISDWTKRTEADVTRFSLGCAVVFKSALIRGSLTALAWVMPPARPLVFLPTAHEACDWCLEQLQKAEIPLPMAARGYLLKTGIKQG
jgi:hypothetical protein